MYDDPYYSHHATRALTRPAALVGFIGSGIGAVGHAVTARTGIPLVDLLRWVEHARGKSIANLVLHDGECALRDEERAGLAHALKGRPHPLLVLGHGTLLSPTNRSLLAEAEAKLVYLRAPLAT
ncbi:MAG: shikimate kinase, partial [Nannocystaceae bacterium]